MTTAFARYRPTPRPGPVFREDDFGVPSLGGRRKKEHYR